MKIHLLSDQSSRLISIYELHSQNSLYEMLVVIRDKCGVYAYRTEFFSRINEFIETSSDEMKTVIPTQKIESSPDKKIEKRMERLVADMPISNIVLSPDF